jgi:hypothetical protein
MIALLMGAGTPVGWADHDEDEIPFAEAELFFELNNTDGDLGIHASIDGEGWKRLIIEDPRERKMLDIRVRGRLKRQGLTQLFFESTEPPFSELSPEVFFQRFPEGVYEIEGITLEGTEMESEATVTHAMPAPPSNITVNEDPLPEDCDEGPVPSVSAAEDILIAWDPVETTHPELGSPQGSTDIEIVVYQVFVDQEDFGLSVDQDPSDTDLLIPTGLLEPGKVLVEILAREKSHNQTASESCFEVVE